MIFKQMNPCSSLGTKIAYLVCRIFVQGGEKHVKKEMEDPFLVRHHYGYRCFGGDPQLGAFPAARMSMWTPMLQHCSRLPGLTTR